MNLRRRQKRKHEQALDAVASVTKLWSEWQIGKRVAKGAAKVKDVQPPSKLKRALSLKWVRIGSAAALVSGSAAAVALKLKRSDEPETYSGPPPSAAADAAVLEPDAAPPLTVAPDPATQERDTEPAGGQSTLRANRDDAADGPSAEKPTEDADEIVRALGAEPPDATAEPPDAEPPDATAEPPDAGPPDADQELASDDATSAEAER
jgi:hypothetical protein